MTDQPVQPDRAELLTLIRDFLVEERGAAPEQVTEDANLDDLEVDSLGLTDLGFRLFMAYDIPLDDNVVLTARTVGDVLDAICSKSPERSRSERGS